MRARFLDAGGIRTRILEAGNGPAMLLLHPVGFSADVWLLNIAPLATRFRVIAPDLLGHGFTDLRDPHGRQGHAAVVEHLEALMDVLDLQQCTVVGSSFGGLLALLLYLRRPQRIPRLVVVGSGTALQTEEETVATLRKTLANASLAYANPTWEACRTRLGNLCVDLPAGTDQLLLSQMTAYAREGASAAYQELLEAMLDVERARAFRTRERLGEVHVPTLVIWGKQDPRSSYARAEECMPLFPDARLVGYDRCGHLPMLEHPARFNEDVWSFCG